MKTSGLYADVNAAIDARIKWVGEALDRAERAHERAFRGILGLLGISLAEHDKHVKAYGAKSRQQYEYVILQRARAALRGDNVIHAALPPCNRTANVSERSDLSFGLESVALANGKLQSLRFDLRALQEMQALTQGGA